MVKNFQEVITSIQIEIDKILTKTSIRNIDASKNSVLEKAASEMLEMINNKNFNSNLKN